MKIPRLSHTLRIVSLILTAQAGGTGCDDNTVQSQDDARRAYLGLDPSIDKAIDLGFQGFNQANSANIPAETAAGALAGAVTVTGQVDQGSSSNKGMRLDVAMAGYSDVAHLTYDTGGGSAGGDAGAAPALPALGMSLKSIPTGTLSGTLVGTFRMSGDLGGQVLLNLTFTGDLQADADGGAGGVTRKPGTVHVTGTATSPAGVFAVDVIK